MRPIAFILFFLVAATAIWNRDLWNPHEYRDGAISLEMARSCDFVVPTLGGQPFLEKPPLFYATGALLVNALGTEPARTIRTASLIFALATQVTVFLTAKILWGSRQALFACGVLATSFGFYQLGHTIVTDVALLFFISLAMLGFVWFAFAGGNRGRELLALGLGGAFLSKGLIGCAIPAVVIVAFSLATRSPRLLWRTVSWQGLLLFGGVAAIWLVPLAQRDGGVHMRAWLDENFGRYFGREA